MFFRLVYFLSFFLFLCSPLSLLFREGSVDSLLRHETMAAAVQEETSHLRWRNLLVTHSLSPFLANCLVNYLPNYFPILLLNSPTPP